MQQQLRFPELKGAGALVQVSMSVGLANPMGKSGWVHCSTWAGTGKPTTFLELKYK